MLNESGPNDWRFKAIKALFDGGSTQEVGQVCCNNPSAKWEQVEDALLHADYADMVQFADELNLEQNNEDKMLNEVKRLQALAGILTEGMSSQEWADAQEEERLDKHPEKDKIKAIQDLMQNADDTSKMPADRDDARNKAYDLKRDAQGLSEEEDEDDDESNSDEFSIGDHVFIKSQRQTGHVMAFNHNEGLITVRLYSGKPVKVDPNELEKMEDEIEDDEYDPDMRRDIRMGR